MRDQTVDQSCERCFATATLPAEHDNLTVFYRQINISNSRRMFIIFPVGKRHIINFYHTICLLENNIFPQKKYHKTCQTKHDRNDILHMESKLTDIGPSDRCAKSPCQCCRRKFIANLYNRNHQWYQPIFDHQERIFAVPGIWKRNDQGIMLPGLLLDPIFLQIDFAIDHLYPVFFKKLRLCPFSTKCKGSCQFSLRIYYAKTRDMLRVRIFVQGISNCS